MKNGLDREHMADLLAAFPQQVADAAQLGKDVCISGKVSQIVVAGMGGSALPGEFLQSYLNVPIPIFVVKGYELPAFIGKETLVFVISYSGNTEETIAALYEAKKKGSMIVVVSSGGKLIALAKQMRLSMIVVPAGMQPRMAYAYLFIPLLNALHRMGIIPSPGRAIAQAARALRKTGYQRQGMLLAAKIGKRIPLIYSSGRWRAISYKWKINFNENAKIHAFSNLFPELNHNEMSGFLHRNGDYFVILIRDPGDHPRVQKRMRVFRRILRQHRYPSAEVVLRGSPLAKLLTGVAIGDWCSYHLALRYRTDPTPVPLIESFKKQLR
ncbi:MAG TPA: bifunctional phosphoglucose/phosphomannose isomerase [Candidatus Nanoarchaeia archaeon]|nr:bifunctional phosphoglucose/phosphomannose isomerase [Candidatus Nanoarchaeia archaeon]